jgi:hypothetical protein
MRFDRSKWVVPGLLVILLLLIVYWVLASKGKTIETAGNPNQDIKSLNIAGPKHQSANVQTISLANPSVAAVTGSGTNAHRIEPAIALKALKQWIKIRDGKDVAIVDAQNVYDLEGRPTSLNVVVTTRLGELTSEKLKTQLDRVSGNDRHLKEQLQEANHNGNISLVNQLAGEFAENRLAFVTTNELSSYKLSLSTERPPVLSFWSGLPFETVREKDARDLAATKLGDNIGLQGLVHYTSVTALLCFTNEVGASIYIDPTHLAEVPLRVLQSPRGRAGRNDDNGRESRVATQWRDFLHQ